MQANTILLNLPENDKPVFLKNPRRATENALYLQTSNIPKVRQLFAETINGVNWKDFLKTVYMRNTSQIITGNLFDLFYCQHNIFCFI